MNVEKEALPEGKLSEGDFVERDRNLFQAVAEDDMFEVFLRDAAIVDLLSPEDEVELAKAMERGQESSKALKKGNDKTLRAEHKINIFIGEEAREHMIVANIPLVVSIAKGYKGRGVPFQDLIQEGNIGLMRGVEGFDYRLGHRLSTYAGWWIRQVITRAIDNMGKTIRVPVHMNEKIYKMNKAEAGLRQELGEDPSDEQVASALGVDLEELGTMKKVAIRSMSLEKLQEEDGDSALKGSDVSKIEKPEVAIENNVLRVDLYNLFEEASLSNEEIEVLELRFGLVHGYDYTRGEVAEHKGLTVRDIKLIQARALKKLRIKGKSKLGDYLR